MCGAAMVRNLEHSKVSVYCHIFTVTVSVICAVDISRNCVAALQSFGKLCRDEMFTEKYL